MLPIADILGQQSAKQTLLGAHARNQIANAYLFTGPPGVGKFTCAVAFAAHVVGDVEKSRLDRDAHPDVRIFAPRDEGAGNIKVEVLREELLPFARYAPFDGAHAFAIFPDADISFPDTHAAGANAILKTLEEPKPGVHFILCSSRPHKLLPTIRSRCQTVRFGSLDKDTLKKILARHEIDAADAEIALSLATGRADLALAAALDPQNNDAFEAMARVDVAVAEHDWGELSRCAEALAKSEVRDLALRLLCGFYRDVAACKLGATVEVPRWKTRAQERAKSFTLDKVTWAAHALSELDAMFEANVNPQLALESFLVEFATR